MEKFKAVALAALLAIAPAGTAAADQLVNEWSGLGRQTTRPFTVDGPWEVQWTWRGSGAFGIRAHTSGRITSDGLAYQREPGSGSAYHPKPGTYYLEIDGTGSWTIRAVRSNDGGR